MSVRVGHIDVFGHLNNVAVFRLLEQSRIEYSVDVGLVRWNELGLILARVDCSFRAQGFLSLFLSGRPHRWMLFPACPRGTPAGRPVNLRDMHDA